MEPSSEEHKEEHHSSPEGIDIVNQFARDYLDTNAPNGNAHSSLHGNQITSTEQEQVGDTLNHSHTEQNEIPVPQAEVMDTEPTASDSRHFDAPSIMHQSWSFPSVNPPDQKETPAQFQATIDDEDDEEESMFVPENYYDHHPIYESRADINEIMNNIDNASELQNDHAAMYTRNPGNTPMHEYSTNEDVFSQQSNNSGHESESNNSEEGYGFASSHLQTPNIDETPASPQQFADFNPDMQGDNNERQPQETPDLNNATTSTECLYTPQEKGLLEVEYQNVLRSIEALESRAALLRGETILTAAIDDELGVIDQEIVDLQKKEARLSGVFKQLNLAVPTAIKGQFARFTGIRKNQSARSAQDYWEKHNKNNYKDTTKKRKILEQETTSDDRRTKKKPKKRPRIYDRMQDGSDMAKQGRSQDLGKLPFENPTQARMTRDSIADGIQPEDDGDQDEAQRTLVRMLTPDVFVPDQSKLLKCAASFGQGNCVKLADGSYRIMGCAEAVRPHQMCGASWQNEKEFSDDKGGIVANEQGTGKTYQAIVNILTHPPTKEAKDEHRTATLIIVPANVLQQWQTELNRFTMRSVSQHTMVYTQAYEKKQGTRNLEIQDVIFITHDQLRRAYFPTAILKQFESPECELNMRDKLRSEHLGFLFKNKWWRVILDEAHAIKDVTTKLFKACRELDAEHRWCLTGTPLPNYSTELWAYLEFLRVPWRGNYNDLQKLLDNLHVPKNKKKFQAWMETIMQRMTLQRQFAGRHLYEIPKCYDEVIIIPFSKEEEIPYRRVEHCVRAAWNKSVKAIAAAKKNVATTKKKTKFDAALSKEEKEEREQLDLRLHLIHLNRLRAATMHPFLLEPTFRATCEEEDFDHMISALSGIKDHKPVVEQLKAHYDKLKHSDQVSDVGDLSELRSFGISEYGGILDIEPYIRRSRAARFEDSCVICLGKLVNGQRPKCGHVCCQTCADDQFLKASKAGDGVPKCIVCRKAVEELKSMDNGTNATFKEDAEMEELREFQAFRAAKMRANVASGNGVTATADPIGRNGEKLGADCYGRQPQPMEENTAWLACADFKYPQPLVPSAKTTMIKQLVLNCRRDHPEDKIIIFSQFQETHQIIGRMLQDEGVGFAYFWGQLSREQKDTVISDFHEKPEMTVLVASLKCGGVGLNITCANRVIITEPWWNAAIELQANARVFRMGQTKKTHFTTLLVKNSIDMRLRSLQADKLNNIESALKYTTPSREEIASLLGRVVLDADGNPYVQEDYME